MLLRFDALDFQFNLHIVSDDHAPIIERFVPVDAEILAVDRAFRRKAGPGISPWVFTHTVELSLIYR